MQTLRNQFLIAMPQLEGSLFAQSLIFLCEHSAQGAMGLIVNRPLPMQLGEILDQLQIDSHAGPAREAPLYFGGPVQSEQGFILHRGPARYLSSLQVNDEVVLCTSRDALEAIGANDGPADYLVALGYAGWSEGQLEQELADNAWLTVPATTDLLFTAEPSRRAAAAAATLGINLSLLHAQPGHA